MQGDSHTHTEKDSSPQSTFYRVEEILLPPFNTCCIQMGKTHQQSAYVPEQKSDHRTNLRSNLTPPPSRVCLRDFSATLVPTFEAPLYIFFFLSFFLLLISKYSLRPLFCRACNTDDRLLHVLPSYFFPFDTDGYAHLADGHLVCSSAHGRAI